MLWTQRLPFLRRHCRELSRALFDTVALQHCAACGELGPELCRPCRHLLELRDGPTRCERCGVPLTEVGRCQADHRLLRGIAFARAPLCYAGTGGALVRRLKFRRDRTALRVLARRMTLALEGWPDGAGRRAVFVSVPLHASKLRRRGVDQASALAGAVADAVGRPFVSRAMRRTRATLPQGDPRVTSRDANVAGAFALRRRRAIAGHTVVLVDDVMTSASTARECGRVLRRGGAVRVVLLTACGPRG